MEITEKFKKELSDAICSAYDQTPDNLNLQIQYTKEDFEGDLTLVVFPLVKLLRQKPEDLANAIGNLLVENYDNYVKFNVVKGFLNVSLSDEVWMRFFEDVLESGDKYGYSTDSKGTIVVEYSSPNTNKPLHLGHIRNNLLGYSVSKILEANGYDVVKTQIINDRGIHICKSMVAWKNSESKDTPESKGVKGDKLVGHYYVEFDKKYKSEVASLIEKGADKKEAEKKAPSMLEAQEELRKWESGDQETVALWKRMNQWVYAGFDITYERLGVTFDKNYYESETYLLGKKWVEKGLEKEVFFKKEDGSVWCDLTEDGLDEKLVLRSDGTAVYMTQDIGTALLRLEDNPDMQKQIYTVGNEQDYHFKVLFLILKKLGFDWADHCYHLSYGMVDLPSGKMKSREGTVVDADDLMEEMRAKAQETTEELGKIEEFDEHQRQALFWQIGLGALKYFILKVDPKKRMLFDPEESVSLQGNTGPFIQYAHARTNAILQKALSNEISLTPHLDYTLNKNERALLRQIAQFPGVLKEAGQKYSPALIANYLYDLVKRYNHFFQDKDCRIFSEDERATSFRAALS
ncbi:MAG: arginine--tRNA ligase, partial [Flavobacteriales bacterium]|nr:arginine--tRNA ligase [Flavobacteriales bacterium]